MSIEEITNTVNNLKMAYPILIAIGLYLYFVRKSLEKEKECEKLKKEKPNIYFGIVSYYYPIFIILYVVAVPLSNYFINKI